MPESSENRSTQPPPDYSSRRVQVRLLLLVGAFMLVVVAMEEARKPKYYLWMWGKDASTTTAENTDESPEDVDTRLAPESNGPASPDDAINTANANRYDENALRAAAEKRNDPVERASIDAWGHMLGDLSVVQRRALNERLLNLRRHQETDVATLNLLDTAISQFDSRLTSYVETARKSLKSGKLLSEAEIAAWHAVLDQVELRWKRNWKPALNALIPEEGPTVGQVQVLEGIQEYIDELDLAAVLDNAVARPAERNAWFRIIEQLQGLENEQAASQSIGVVGFLQLHKQPEDYRGKLVTVRGKARLGYRVTARSNLLGIKEYSLIWIKPRGGPNTLIAIHCLETPGLPPLKHKDRDRGVTELDHDVEITGYFFKKWAYRAKDGIRTAPQLLARSPIVESTSWQAITTPPSSQLLTIVAAGAALIGVLVALGFYYVNQWPSRINKPPANVQGSLASIDPDEVSRGVAFELRKLENESDDHAVDTS